MQELSQVLRGGSQHALLLKVLDSSLWFLVEPGAQTQIRLQTQIPLIERGYRRELNSQVDALLDDLLLLLEDLELLGVVGARHLGAVAADAGRGRGVQRVDAAIAVDGLRRLGLRALLLRWFLLT